MKNLSHSENRRARRAPSFGLEFLETRDLLSTATASAGATSGATFNGPSLSDLIQQARGGTDTAPAAISRMEQALQAQLTSGSLADLEAGKVGGNGFVTEVQNLEASYEQNLDQQLSPEFPNVDAILKLQGQKVVADVIALNQEVSVGLISSATLATDARVAIDSLTTSPIDPLNPSLGAYTSATQLFETELNTLAKGLVSSSSSASTLTPAQVSATALAETQAFLANMHAGLQVVHPYVSSQVDAAVAALESAESGLAQDTAASAQSALRSAVSAFDSAMIGSGGVFDPAGPVAKAMDRGAFTPNTGQPQAGATLANVSGTAMQGGNATLTATLTASDGGSAIAGETVVFTLDGAFAGVATTDSNGVATLTGVPTNNPAGTDTGGVVASFAGNRAYQSASGTGDLTVS